ncbi:MAG: hypothetical protein PHV59_08665 [Victivallales bacterium]|nr:hypothetical protein [Victivallales bacterium]
MKKTPSTNGDNGGRDSAGRFTKGNPGGKGNPYAKQVAQLRAAMMKAVTKKDIQDIVKKLVTEAKTGNIRAIDLLLTRIFGTPVSVDVLEEINEMEQAINEFREAKK